MDAKTQVRDEFVPDVAKRLVAKFAQAGTVFTTRTWCILETPSGPLWANMGGLLDDHDVMLLALSESVSVFISPLAKKNTTLTLAVHSGRQKIGIEHTGEVAAMLANPCIANTLRLCDSLFNGELLNYARQKLVPATDPATTSFLSALIETLAD